MKIHNLHFNFFSNLELDETDAFISKWSSKYSLQNAQVNIIICEQLFWSAFYFGISAFIVWGTKKLMKLHKENLALDEKD